jgi:hypothetical protein
LSHRKSYRARSAIKVKDGFPFRIGKFRRNSVEPFRAVVIECGVMMMKRLAEVIVGRIKKKEKIDITESEDTNNDY